MQTSSWIDNSVHGEDAILRVRRKDALLLVVCDGVSSTEGARASNAVIAALKHLRVFSPDTIRDTLRTVHEKLSSGKPAMTTIVGALITDKVFLFGVGDSPAITIENDTAQFALPIDRHPDDPAAVVHVIGDGEFVLHEKTITIPETLVLCSDGISDNIGLEGMTMCARQSARATLNALLKKLRRREDRDHGVAFDDFKEDDASVIIFQR